MSIIYSYVELTHTFLNSTGNEYDSYNTDGADTVQSSHIIFDRWEVCSGDDGIVLKVKSANIVVKNSVFHNGLGVAPGSIGQFETIEGSHVESVYLDNTLQAAYVKTRTADQNGYALNDGGGGLGYAKDTSFENLAIQDLREAAAVISNCTRSGDSPGDGNSTNSEFHAGAISCNPVGRIDLNNIDLRFVNGASTGQYLSGNAEGQPDF